MRPYNNLQQKFGNIHYFYRFRLDNVVSLVMEFFGTKTPCKLLIQYQHIDGIERKKGCLKTLKIIGPRPFFFVVRGVVNIVTSGVHLCYSDSP